MWWFLVLTFGSSIVPVYIAPQGPFPSQLTCESVRAEVMRGVQAESRQIRSVACWSDSHTSK